MLILALLFVHVDIVRSFASSPKPAFSIIDSFKSIFNDKTTQNAAATDTNKRAVLKEKIFAACQSKNEDESNKREKIEALIEEISPLSPVVGTARSPLLQKEWLLVWTTEKEINFFLDWNIGGQISQSINNDQLGNMIEFKKGGGLGVTGELSFPDEDDDELGIRTNFKFTTASLDLGRWGKYDLPPVGEGWFDTVYLDEELRIDTNSRDDILICTPL
eukprot:CAMPEP_0185734670 /NCGR_PEP_ID=MMETSP1171-20130828/23166_1 /TAXON_ID=374046 /ORGANISM="Helicotheca tamensis, Strain CCMP826" /LENGTH=217 /DNA_ID=CAMNT_0028404731 /DNA_START=77 /DNA_END=730 /DNA_ORIENTATION=+